MIAKATVTLLRLSSPRFAMMPPPGTVSVGYSRGTFRKTGQGHIGIWAMLPLTVHIAHRKRTVKYRHRWRLQGKFVSSAKGPQRTIVRDGAIAQRYRVRVIDTAAHCADTVTSPDARTPSLTFYVTELLVNVSVPSLSDATTHIRSVDC